MTCYNPIQVCYSKSLYAKTGKKDIHIVQREKEKYDSAWYVNESYYPHSLYEYIYLPCRKCAGCRSDNAKMWSLRAYNELMLHKNNCFITLTYNSDNPLVSNDPRCLVDLRYKHFQNFMKRLRKRFPNDKIGYLVCGEYGPKDGRSHWHAILFGFDFPDKQLVYVKKGYNHYYSQILQDCWSVYNKEFDCYHPIGFIDLCDCDYDCCSYVAQYVLKKLPIDQVHYDLGTTTDKFGRVVPKERTLPMVKSSRNPAIGLNWYKKYGSQACENGFVSIKTKNSSKRIRTPSYYFSKFEIDNPVRYEMLRAEREEKMKEYYKKYPVNWEKLALWNEAHLYKIKKALKDCLTKFIK